MKKERIEYFSPDGTFLSFEEIDVPDEPTPEEKLAAAGLTVEDLKNLLGLS